jgi:hypothetical protein
MNLPSFWAPWKAPRPDRKTIAVLGATAPASKSSTLEPDPYNGNRRASLAQELRHNVDNDLHVDLRYQPKWDKGQNAPWGDGKTPI